MKQKILRWIFSEKDETFSWRKGLTAIAGTVFFIAAIGFIFNIAAKLPDEYILVISGVFTYYFLKTILSKPNKNNENADA